MLSAERPNLYNWQRFWCIRGGAFNLGDRGYLVDPLGEYGEIYNPGVFPLHAVAAVPCLVLLGEPGMGKSVAVDAEYERIQSELQTSGDVSLRFDLRQFQSEERLCAKVFGNPTVAAWRGGSHYLHLFIDSLDECLLRIETVVHVLGTEFLELPIERLCVRIACRTAEWPGVLESALVKLWGEDRIGVLELAPLRRCDVEHAATIEGLDSEVFLHEVERRQAEALAIKPVTLKLLLNAYRSERGFPTSQAELYRKGCQLLCDEINESRRATGRDGALTPSQRLAIASRIAAVTVFANRHAIFTDVDQGNVPEADVTLDDLCGGREIVQGQQMIVDRAAVREALRTGLFSARGSGEMGWAHQTYAEFLAADYIRTHHLALAQCQSLFLLSSDQTYRVIPQLRETAAWLAGMDESFFHELVQTDPEVLLRSDVATAAPHDRQALVDALLNLYDQELAVDNELGRRALYSRLRHPQLANQLRPFILDRQKGIIVRRVAIDIAEACEEQGLAADLLRVALDATADAHIRVQTAHAICRIGPTDAKLALKPLITGNVGDDPDDQLKGWALQALWPGHLEATELFASLTPPKKGNFFGAYQAFLYSHLSAGLRVQDLPTALEWVQTQQISRFDSESPSDAILVRGWDSIDEPDVLLPFAQAVAWQLKNRHHVTHHDAWRRLASDLATDATRRRRLLAAIVQVLPNVALAPTWLVFSGVGFIATEDVPWMLEQLQATASEDQQKVWACLVRRAHDWQRIDHTDLVLAACDDCSLLRGEYADSLDPVILDSPKAREMREHYEALVELAKRRNEPELLDPSPIEKVGQQLDRFEQGELDAWWHLNLDMMVEPDGSVSTSEFNSDLTSLPVWVVADETMRLRLVTAAYRYVLERDPDTEKWLGTNTFYRPAAAGYRAIRLLHKLGPAVVQRLPREVWVRWAPAIVSFPTVGVIPEKGSERAVQRALVALAYPHAQQAIISALLQLIERDNTNHSNVFIIDVVQECWDDVLLHAVLYKAQELHLHPNATGALVGALLERGVTGVRNFAETILTLPLPQDDVARQRALAVSQALLGRANDAGWSLVWPLISSDREFGRHLVEGIAHMPRAENEALFPKLTASELADLYSWLVGEYPPVEDPAQDNGAHFVGPRESVVWWRDSIIQYLRDLGTEASVMALRRLRREVSQVGWLQWSVLIAQENLRRHTWTPPTPDEILALGANASNRLVQTPDQLLDVLVESLGRFQIRLTGETPAVRSLWDKRGRDIWRPIDENEFSDSVKIFLEDDLRGRGIVVNREVQIRSGIGSATGERTDIHVDLVKRDLSGEADVLTVVIEIKGCWHRELLTAMETQLVGRYLSANHYKHGIYLVGWFLCDGWDPRDLRKKSALSLKREFEQMRTALNTQAEALSEAHEVQVRAVVIDARQR